MSMVSSQKSIGGVVGVAVGKALYKIGDRTDLRGDLIALLGNKNFYG